MARLLNEYDSFVSSEVGGLVVGRATTFAIAGDRRGDQRANKYRHTERETGLALGDCAEMRRSILRPYKRLVFTLWRHG